MNSDYGINEVIADVCGGTHEEYCKYVNKIKSDEWYRRLRKKKP
jgi:hypothetical protein